MWVGDGDNGTLLQAETVNGALEAYNRLTADIGSIRELLPRLEELRDRCQAALGGQLAQGLLQRQPILQGAPPPPPHITAAAAPPASWAAPAPAAPAVATGQPLAKRVHQGIHAAQASQQQPVQGAPAHPSSCPLQVPAAQASLKQQPAQEQARASEATAAAAAGVTGGAQGLVRRIVGAGSRIEARVGAAQPVGKQQQQQQGLSQKESQEQEQAALTAAKGKAKKKRGKKKPGEERAAAAAAPAAPRRLLVGVSKCKKGWRARLKPNKYGPRGKKERALGIFNTEEEAARAYDRGMLVHQLQHQEKVHAMLNHPLEEYLRDADPEVAAAAARVKARIGARQAEKAVERAQQGQQAQQGAHASQQAPCFSREQLAVADAPGKLGLAATAAGGVSPAGTLPSGGQIAAAAAAVAGAAAPAAAGGVGAGALPPRQPGQLKAGQQQGQAGPAPAGQSLQAGAAAIGGKLPPGSRSSPASSGMSSPTGKPKLTPVQALRRQKWQQQQQQAAAAAAGVQLPGHPSGQGGSAVAQVGQGHSGRQQQQQQQPQQPQQQQGLAARQQSLPIHRQTERPLVNLAKGAGQGASAVERAMAAAAACPLGYQSLPDALMRPLREAAQHAQQEKGQPGSSAGSSAFLAAAPAPAAGAAPGGPGTGGPKSSLTSEGGREPGAAAVNKEGPGVAPAWDDGVDDLPLAKRQHLLRDRHPQAHGQASQQAQQPGAQQAQRQQRQQEPAAQQQQKQEPAAKQQPQTTQQQMQQRPESGTRAGDATAAAGKLGPEAAAAGPRPGEHSSREAQQGGAGASSPAEPLQRLPPVELGPPRPPPLLLQCPGAQPLLAGAVGLSPGKRRRQEGGQGGGTPPPQLLSRWRGPSPNPHRPGQRGGQLRGATPEVIDMTWLEGGAADTGAHAARCACPKCKSTSPEVIDVKPAPRKVVSPEAFWEAAAGPGSASKAGGGGGSAAGAAAGGRCGGGGGGGGGTSGHYDFSDPEAARQFKRSFTQPAPGKLAGAFRAARKQAAATAAKSQKPPPKVSQTVWQQAAAAWRQKNKPSEFEVKAEEARQAKRARQEREKAGWNPAAAAAAERATHGGAAAAAAAGRGCGFTMPGSSRGGARGAGAAAQGSGRGVERRAQQAPEPVPPARDPNFSSLPEGERRGRYRDYNQQRVAGCRSFADVLCAFRVKFEAGGLKEGYRQAVRMYHPDSNSKERLWGNPEQKMECEEIMKIINERKPEKLD